jgi:hypothetical protein
MSGQGKKFREFREELTSMLRRTELRYNLSAISTS